MSGLLFTIVSFCFIVLLSITYFSKNRIKLIRNKLYKYLLIIELFLLITEIISSVWIIYGTYSEIPYILLRFHWYSGIVWFTFLYYYCVVFIEDSKETKLVNIIKKSKSSIAILILYIIGNIVFFFMPFSEIHPNDNFSYIPGAVGFYVYAYSSFCVLLITLHFFKYRNNAKRRTKASVLAIIIEILLVALFQSLFTTISISAIGIALQLFFLYFNIENPDLELIRELEISRNEIEKSSNAKTDFLSNMSHEIKIPMNTIIGISQAIVADDYKEENLKEDLSNISKAGRNLLDIINNVLDISRIESGQEKLELKEYNLDSIINDLEKMVNKGIENKNIKFINKIDETVPSVLYGDYSKVYQVLLNVVSNAVKYTDLGRITIELKYELKGNDEVLLHFRVSDTGYGIKQEDYEKLFEKFSRLDVALNKEIEGSGLGLVIAKQFVDLMDGKIWFDSKYMVGTNFYIDLTQKIIDSTSIKEKKQIESESSASQFIDCSNYKILLVDDNELNLKVERKMFSKYNFQIEEVQSGRECVDLIKGWNKYDMIFVDYMMSEMSGSDVLKILKRLKDYDVPPIIVLTANTISGMRETYLQEGFDDYITKPINMEDLNKIVLKYFNK